MCSLRADRFRRLVIVVSLLFSVSVLAQKTQSPARSAQTASERRTELGLEVARKDPLALRAFLVTMPKGADLHNHLSGAVYAESFIRAAAEDNLCVDTSSNSFA